MTKIKEEEMDPSIFEDAYLEDPELQMQKGAEKLYGELPILKSSSKEVYSIHPHKLWHFHQKLEYLIEQKDKYPDNTGLRLVNDEGKIGREFWKASILDFIRHLEDIGIVYGPVNGLIESIRTEEGDGELELSIKDKPVRFVCDIPFIHIKRLTIFRDSLLYYIFTYKNSGVVYDEDKFSGCEPIVTTDCHGNDVISPDFRKNKEDVTLVGGNSVMSGVLFEKILGLFSKYGIIDDFIVNPELTKAMSDHIGITREEYLIYRLEYFLLNIWTLNEPGFWWRICSFFELHYGKNTRFIAAFKQLLLSELPPANLADSIENSPAVAPNVQNLVFGDITFQLGEKGFVKIGKSEPINANDKEFVKMIKYEGNNSKLTEIKVNFDKYDLKRGIKTLYAIIRHGENLLGSDGAKVYTRGPDSFAKHATELSDAIPKFINKTDMESIIIKDLVSLANRALDRFESNMTMRREKLLFPITEDLRMKDGVIAPILGKRIPENSEE